MFYLAGTDEIHYIYSASGGMLVFPTVAGGIGSAAMGGNFWQGAVNGLIVAALNHLKHKGQVERYSKREGRKFRDELWQSATEQKKEMIGYQLEDDSYFAYYDERNDRSVW